MGWVLLVPWRSKNKAAQSPHLTPTHTLLPHLKSDLVSTKKHVNPHTSSSSIKQKKKSLLTVNAVTGQTHVT